MRKLKLFVIGIFVLLIVVRSSFAFREYLVMGKVIGLDKNPIKDVKIILVNTETNRRFKFKTNKKGEYKIAGISHGKYKVNFIKDGYKTQETEWDLSSQQSRIKKVKIEPIIMITEEKYKSMLVNKELKKKYEKAEKLVKEMKYEKAAKLFKEILEEKPDEVNSNYFLGICYEKTGKLEEAKQLYLKVVKQKPDFAPVNFRLAVIYQKENKLDESLEYYKKTIELDKKSWVSLYNAGIILFQKDKIDEAIDYFLKTLEINPTDGPTLEYLGICYVKKNDTKNAIKYLEKAKNSYKNNPNKIKTINEILKSIKK